MQLLAFLTMQATYVHAQAQTHHILIYVLPHMRILAHTRMGRPIRVYSYGTPIRIWDNILSHISINILFGSFISLQAFWLLLHAISNNCTIIAIASYTCRMHNASR